MLKMKKMLMLAIVALGIVSCTENENTQDTAGMEKTSVVMSLNAANTTGKQINKTANIPVWVSKISVTAKSNVFASYTASEFWDVVASGGENAFLISDVAVGSNLFTGTTTSFDANKKYSLIKSNTVTPTQAKDAAIADAIYAVYSGTTTANVLNTGTNVVNIPLTTQNGRIISIFALKNDAVLRANTYFTVVVETEGEADKVLSKVENTEVGSYVWGNEKSLNGKKVKFTVKVYDKGDTTNPVTLLKTIVVTETVKGSTSINCIYEVTRDKVFRQDPSELTFTFQEWVNEGCESVYIDDQSGDDAGEDDDYNCQGWNKQGFNRCGYHKVTGNYNANQDRDLSDGNTNQQCNNGNNGN